jgi:hypothetical protein
MAGATQRDYEPAGRLHSWKEVVGAGIVGGPRL